MGGVRGLMVGLGVLLSACASWSVQLAFPGAEGEGRWACGGRGGQVYHVTNLDDSGPGSLRYGIETGVTPLTIVFDVGGAIALNSPLTASRSYLTIAGQTAPGDGVCLKGYGLVVRDCHDVIVQHLRIRPGDVEAPGFNDDALNVIGGPSTQTHNVMIDHCSTSWGIDETLSVFGNVDAVTVQWCIIAEGLHCTGFHDYGPDVCHSKGSLSRAKYQSGSITYHHNLWAHNDARNPRLGSYDDVTLWADIRNNVMYDWGDNYCGQGCIQDTEGERCNMNYVGNYIIRGPDTSYTRRRYAFYGGNASYMDIYQSDNRIDYDLDGRRDGINTGWTMFTGDYDDKSSAFAMEPVTTQSADAAYQDVLDSVGALPWGRDAVDIRIVADVVNETGGIIDSQAEVGGWAALAGGAAWPDSDGDGMSDAWETGRGLNKNAPDNNGDDDGDGYTNLEEYLHELCLLTPEALHYLAALRACDLNGDGIVSLHDFHAVANAWLAPLCSTHNEWCFGADITQDRNVNLSDLVLLADFWLERYEIH